jgi:acetyl esterase/lipase
MFIMVLNIEAQEVEILRKELVYKQVDDQLLSVDVFYPNELPENQQFPAIAFFHGGGWVFGSPEEFHGACERYAKKGFVTFSFQYRLSINKDGSYPNPDISPIESVKDARSAIRWLREHAGELNIDPNKITVSGQSAGGQLALSTALMDNINEQSDDLDVSPEPNALLLYSSCVNTMEAWIDYIMSDRRDQIWSISPYHNLKPGMPPILAFHGEADCMVLFYTIQFFNTKMKDLGNSYELVTLPGRDHYLGENADPKYARYFDEEILERSDAFLEQLGYME